MKTQILEIAKKLQSKEITTDNAQTLLLGLFSVSEHYLHINDAAALIKSMPTDQAIQKMKAALSGQPETTVISGELLVSFHNAR